MDDEVIDKLWGQSNHGTYREDIEAAYIAGYNAGVDAEREACAKVCDHERSTPERGNVARFLGQLIRGRSNAMYPVKPG